MRVLHLLRACRAFAHRLGVGDAARQPLFPRAGTRTSVAAEGVGGQVPRLSARSGPQAVPQRRPAVGTGRPLQRRRRFAARSGAARRSAVLRRAIAARLLRRAHVQRAQPPTAQG